MEKLVDGFNKLFQKQSTAVMVGILGAVAAFAVIIVCGCFLGDFVKSKRALRLVADGQIEKGRGLLKQITLASEDDGLCYALVIARPYEYSLTKKMPAFMLVSTAFFTGLSLFVSLSMSGIFTTYTVIVFLAPAFSGLALCVLTFAIKCSMQKTTALYFVKAAEMIKSIPVTDEMMGGNADAQQNGQKADGRQNRYQADDESLMRAEILSLCARIEDVALAGGADHRVLSTLYSEIKVLQQKANTPVSEAKLAAALEVLIVLIDSAL